MSELTIIGVNHKTASIDVREKLTFDPERKSVFLANINDAFDEIVILSTCNRTEIIFTQKDSAYTDRILEQLGTMGSIPREDFQQYFYVYRREKALQHLFRVACGLDSMVVGETQILGQVKNAFEFSLKNGHTKDKLNRIYQRMLNA